MVRTTTEFCPCGRADRSRSLGIRVLNLLILIPLLTASINGLDSSLVNGALTVASLPRPPRALTYCCRPANSTLLAGFLQTPQRKNSRHVTLTAPTSPSLTPSTLTGLISAAQVIGSIAVRPNTCPP